jgi:hypothetical protein
MVGWVRDRRFRSWVTRERIQLATYVRRLAGAFQINIERLSRILHWLRYRMRLAVYVESSHAYAAFPFPSAASDRKYSVLKLPSAAFRHSACISFHAGPAFYWRSVYHYHLHTGSSDEDHSQSLASLQSPFRADSAATAMEVGVHTLRLLFGSFKRRRLISLCFCFRTSDADAMPGLSKLVTVVGGSAQPNCSAVGILG